MIQLGLILMGLCLSLAIAWWRSCRTDEQNLPTWRQRTLLFGLIGNSVSLVLYLADLVRFQLIMRRVVEYTGVGWADTYALAALFVLALACTICGAFGRGLGRLLTIVDGILLAFLWIFLAAGTSE